MNRRGISEYFESVFDEEEGWFAAPPSPCCLGMQRTRRDLLTFLPRGILVQTADTNYTVKKKTRFLDLF